MTASAIAHPNIAFIKYWGNRDDALRLPQNGSISMNLSSLETRTTVRFDVDLSDDTLELNGSTVTGAALNRVSDLLDLARQMAGVTTRAAVASNNSFPTGAGIASSASAFAALSLAASSALGLALDESALSRLARRGSGSASRSIPDGFVEWHPGSADHDSYARSIAPASHWELVDLIAVIESEHKPTGSTQGHALASSSPLQQARVDSASVRLERCRNAILERDFMALAEVAELDSNLMHAVMMTSNPSLFYWAPASLTIMKAVTSWRQLGLPAFYTLDAGANVHVITLAGQVDLITARLCDIPGITQVFASPVGGAARLITSP